jgi:hypothetical protein
MIGPRSFPSSKLNESERLQRVAEILCKVILLSEVDVALHVSDANERSKSTTLLPVRPMVDHPEDERILRYLALVGEASPVEIRGTLGMSRSSTWRALQRLAQASRIMGSGQTRKLVYQLNAGEPPADRIGLN